MTDNADAAELSSVISSLGDVTDRIAALAERRAGTRTDDATRSLFEVERSLTTAARRLEQALAALQRG